MIRIAAILALLATPGDGVSWTQIACDRMPEIGVDVSTIELQWWTEKCRAEKITGWMNRCRNRGGFVSWTMDGEGRITEYRCEQLCRCEGKVGP